MSKWQAKSLVTGIALTVLLTAGSSAHAEPMRCEIKSKFNCTPAGCVPNTLGVFNLVDPDAGTFSRCDQNDCDEYEAKITRSGAYLVVEVPGRGVLAKLSLNGAEYVEIATIGTAVLVSFGACRDE